MRGLGNAQTDFAGISLPSNVLGSAPGSSIGAIQGKYLSASYSYLQQIEGMYGSASSNGPGLWEMFPSMDTWSCGPTKQGNLNGMSGGMYVEETSNHWTSECYFNMAPGQVINRLFGPEYFKINQFSSTITTPQQMAANALIYFPQLPNLYDDVAGQVIYSTYNTGTVIPSLNDNGYALSTARGILAPTITNGGSSTANTSWTVLSDPETNFQFTNQGRQYWVSQNPTGTATINNVTPGTYRLSQYVLGEWGELRHDGISISANQTTSPSLTFVPENFGTASPIWTIGTPDRSAHEYLHGKNPDGSDARYYYGEWNYWGDFASTSGQQVYYATAEGSTPATNNPLALNYNQWTVFDPGLNSQRWHQQPEWRLRYRVGLFRLHCTVLHRESGYRPDPKMGPSIRDILSLRAMLPGRWIQSDGSTSLPQPSTSQRPPRSRRRDNTLCCRLLSRVWTFRR